MAGLTWDKTGEHLYETGVRNGVLYVYDADTQKYGAGVAWNGLTAVTESPSGAEETALYADDIKYLALRSNEEFGFTIEAYTYPDEWMQCDGSVGLTDNAKGVVIGQQKRKTFGFVYKTVLGNDVDGNDLGYKLHIIYGATASPSERSYATINDSPEAITFSWECTTLPVPCKGYKPVSLITIDSTKADPGALSVLEDVLFGNEEQLEQASLPTPDAVITIMQKKDGLVSDQITSEDDLLKFD